MSWNIPNILTLSRILLIPVVLYLHSHGQTAPCLLLISLALLTDFFDGYLARKLQQETAFGALFDPIADKLVAIVFYAYILYNDLAPLWITGVVLLRNFSQLMSVPILIFWLKKTFHVKPSRFAKWTTGVSDLFILIPLFYPGEWRHGAFLLIPFVLAELYILGTYLPRLYQIATDQHDTFT